MTYNYYNTASLKNLKQGCAMFSVLREHALNYRDIIFSICKTVHVMRLHARSLNPVAFHCARVSWCRFLPVNFQWCYIIRLANYLQKLNMKFSFGFSMNVY